MALVPPCDFPCVLTAADIRRAKTLLDGEFARTNIVAMNCTALAQTEWANWVFFYSAFRAFRDSDDSFVHAGIQYKVAQDYERQLAEHQDLLKQKCGLTGGVRPGPDPSTPGGLSDTVKTVATAAMFVVGGLVLLQLIPHRR